MATSAAAEMAGVPMYKDLSLSTLQHLSSMLNDKILPTTPYFFHSATFIFFVFLWAFTLLISFAMRLGFGKRYTKMNFDQRRTSDIYVLNCVLTSVAAALQFACLGSFSLGFQRWQFDLVRVAALLVASNYVFEMIYRPRMRYPMIAHHILTLFLMMLTLSVLYEVKDPTMLLSGNMLMFLATLEQPTFLALLFYRLRFNQRLVNWTLRIASVQTVIFKSVAAAGAIAIWLKWQRFDKSTTSTAYNVLFWISIGALYITQWYGAIVTYKISYGLKKRYETHYTTDSTPGLEELQTVHTMNKFEHEVKKRRNPRSRYSGGTFLPDGIIPTRTSSIYSPSPSSSATPLPPMDTPSSMCIEVNPYATYMTTHPNAPVEAWQTNAAPNHVNHGRSGPPSSAASSVYEMPSSVLTHERRRDIESEVEAIASPAPTATQFPSQRRKPSHGHIGEMA
ncbi:hypothetical protein CF319_g4869 [Tilletia indica]|nr:hypothetical protein CF319_g4869 [Tilletia indica]KAE8233772.1 hypothetical protein CF326_g1193 [Tilletia indica]